ncbi:MAG: hypothetical protein JSS04_04530 [Proteobacteria bacterium]|nr:hypothetical protein [Pseudomonadota bacterium]
MAEKLAGIETYLLPLDQATPEALRVRLASQISLWTPIIERAGVQVKNSGHREPSVADDPGRA